MIYRRHVGAITLFARCLLAFLYKRHIPGCYVAALSPPAITPPIIVTMGLQPYSRETEVKVPPSKLWKVLVVDSQEHVPLIQEDSVVGIEYEGKAFEVGSIRKVKLHKQIYGLDYVKEKVEKIDHAKHIVKFSVVEGGLASKFKHVEIEIEFKEGHDSETTIVKNTILYEAEEGEKLPQEYLDGSLGLLKSAEAYLLQHNEL